MTATVHDELYTFFYHITMLHS